MQNLRYSANKGSDDAYDVSVSLTFEAVRTVFVEMFCTPKSLMENPSLHVSGHVSSMRGRLR